MILQLHFSLLSPNPDGPTLRAKEQMIDVPPPLFLSPIIKSASFHNAERREKYSISLASVPSVRRRRRRRTKSREREFDTNDDLKAIQIPQKLKKNYFKTAQQCL